MIIINIEHVEIIKRVILYITDMYPLLLRNILKFLHTPINSKIKYVTISNIFIITVFIL